MQVVLRFYHAVAGTNASEVYERKLGDFVAATPIRKNEEKDASEERYGQGSSLLDHNESVRDKTVKGYNEPPLTPENRPKRTELDDRETEDSGYYSRFATPSFERAIESTPSKSPSGARSEIPVLELSPASRDDEADPVITLEAINAHRRASPIPKWTLRPLIWAEDGSLVTDDSSDDEEDAQERGKVQNDPLLSLGRNRLLEETGPKPDFDQDRQGWLDWHARLARNALRRMKESEEALERSQKTGDYMEMMKTEGDEKVTSTENEVRELMYERHEAILDDMEDEEEMFAGSLEQTKSIKVDEEDGLEPPDPRFHQLIYNDQTDAIETISIRRPTDDSDTSSISTWDTAKYYAKVDAKNEARWAKEAAEYKAERYAELRAQKLFDLSNPAEPLPPRNEVNKHFEYESAAVQDNSFFILQQSPCLQCIVKELPCDKGIPVCKRCKRDGGCCLVQRELLAEERWKIGIWNPETWHEGNTYIEEVSYTVLVRLRWYDDEPEVWEMKKALEAKLLEYLEEHIERRNWVLPVNDGRVGGTAIKDDDVEKKKARRKRLEVDFARGDGVGMIRDFSWRHAEEYRRPKRNLRGCKFFRSGEKVDWELRVPVGMLG